MASAATETTPLIASPSNPTKPQRTVTFNTELSIAPSRPGPSHIRPPLSLNPTFPSPQYGSPPTGFSALNSRLRRRNSHGAPLSAPPTIPPTFKIGPQRTTKNAQKLKLLPNPDPGVDGPDEESGRDVYSQFTRIKDPTARRDAARLGKVDRDRLPRVTAYCTANTYRLDGLMKFLKSRGKTRGASPKQFDECIYSPFSYDQSKSRRKSSTSATEGDAVNGSGTLTTLRDRRSSDSALEVDKNQTDRRDELVDLSSAANDEAIEGGEASHNDGQHVSTETQRTDREDLDTQIHTPEVFLFQYGTVVIWGMTLAQEQRFLKDIAKFETEKLEADDVQTEDFNFYYTREYQPRIYNDFISLREKQNYMTKLAISHALAQSVKVITLHPQQI